MLKAMARRDHIAATSEDAVNRRFSRRIIRNADGCWIYGPGRHDGYGYISILGELIPAHRYSLIKALGIPSKDKYLACHRCNVKRCVRPDHLYWGSYSDNLNDRNATGGNFYEWTRGENSHKATLREKDIPIIWAEYHCSRQRVSVLAKQFGVTPATLENVVKGRSWVHVTKNLGKMRRPDGMAFGAHQGLAKLTDDIVLNIKKAISNGCSRASQARLYGVSSTTITHIMSGKTWRHVTWPV